MDDATRDFHLTDEQSDQFDRIEHQVLECQEMVDKLIASLEAKR